MRFNSGHILAIVFYSVLMVLSAIGNLTVLIVTWRRRRKANSSRINTMLMHLAIADLLVTFILMPIEIIWAATVAWWAGDTVCRIASFFRTFGLYQSSFVLVCISLDRYFAVLKPMRFSDVDRRSKMMLICAWLGSVICSFPQMLVFKVQRHPNITFYEQCITINSFPSEAHELTYSLFGMIMMYAFPLTVIIFSYTSILTEICKKSRAPIEEHFSDSFRRSSLGFFERARSRTLKMTIVIFLAFFICWTPYHIMAFWYWIDKKTAKGVDQRIQRGLFLFACTNSSINPIVYGAFNFRNKHSSQSRGRLGTNNTCTTGIRLPPLPLNPN
ncbi:hypothetical protein AAG570_012869 [Ranatra chinensis]|uniref:G-protein coupled receptors family 1 profile domain-containing protein n=1 Tax=Ranatra chinensis TaxID=642074 RepID=A0ABD0YF94_9HEMI